MSNCLPAGFVVPRSNHLVSPMINQSGLVGGKGGGGGLGALEGRG